VLLAGVFVPSSFPPWFRPRSITYLIGLIQLGSIIISNKMYFSSEAHPG
jgi:hypothetical protein